MKHNIFNIIKYPDKKESAKAFDNSALLNNVKM